MQSDFVPRTGTQDNVIVAQEVMYYTRKSKSKKNKTAFKIDLEKAYYSLDWLFRKATLRSLVSQIILFV